MADTAHALGWTYVNTLADSGTYGEKGIQAFTELTKNSGLCVSQSETIPRGADDDKLLSIVRSLFRLENNAHAIMMFANEDNSRRVVKALKKLNLTDQVHLLASDSWGAKRHPVYKQEAEAEGTVTLLPKRSVIPGFDEYFLNLTLNNSRNPWFKEYWEDIFNCTLDVARPGIKKCTGRETLREGPAYEQEGLVQFVIDSVFALAHAVHDMLTANCPDTFVRCAALKQLSGPEFLGFIRNVSFTGLSGVKVRFNKDGDSLGRYDLYQFQRDDNNKFVYVKVGEWIDRLYLNTSLLKWKNGSVNIPVSKCSEPCKFGESKITSRGECCWMCIPCKDNEYMPDEGTCENCPKNHRPNATLTGCERLPMITLVPISLWFVLPVAFSLAGVLCTIFVFGVFLAFNRTPIIMASGRELCYILLLGIALSYCTSMSMLAEPSSLSCAIRRLGLGVSLCFVYAAILTKTNRIYRIFSVGIKAMVKRPSYTSPKSQIFICAALVSVQVVGGFTWLGFEKPDVNLVLHQKSTLVLKCRASQVATIVSLFYNIFLIILCTVYAFKTRKIPQNFNEAKYIAFTMYSTCIVWLAFIPIYFGANHDFKIEVTSLCMCVNISATVALFCLFAPKVYIVLLQPHKNVRQTSAASLSTANKTARTFYDAARSSMSCGASATAAGVAAAAASAATAPAVTPPTAWSPYGDLNGGVYCGEMPSTTQFSSTSAPDRKRRSSHVTLSTTAATEIPREAPYQHQYQEIHSETNEEEEEDDEEKDFLDNLKDGMGDVIMEDFNGRVKETLTPQMKEIIHFAKFNHAGINEYDDYEDSSCDETSPVKILTTEIT